jgi:hypothetical protein
MNRSATLALASARDIPGKKQEEAFALRLSGALNCHLQTDIPNNKLIALLNCSKFDPIKCCTIPN